MKHQSTPRKDKTKLNVAPTIQYSVFTTSGNNHFVLSFEIIIIIRYFYLQMKIQFKHFVFVIYFDLRMRVWLQYLRCPSF